MTQDQTATMTVIGKLIRDMHEHPETARFVQDLSDAASDGNVIAPESDVIVPFPSTGAPVPCASGTVAFDLDSGTVVLPENSAGDANRTLWTSEGPPPRLQTALIWADDDIQYRLIPGYGTIYHQGSSWVAIPLGRSSFQIILARPCNLFVLFTSRKDPARVAPYGSFQERHATETITKTEAAGTPDTFTALTFAPAFDGTNLTPTDENAGVANIHCGPWAHKSFLFENGANDVDVNIQGRHQAGGNWVDDPSTGESYRVDASRNKVLIVEREYHQIRVRTRIAGMIAAAQTSAVVVQYRGKSAFGDGVADETRHESQQLRPASGALTAIETVDAILVPPWARKAVLRLDVTTLTTPDGDDEVDFYVQTSFNRGTDFADVANVHYATADNGTTPIVLITLDRAQQNVGAVTETDGTIADDTRNNLPLGDRIRVKTAVTGATPPTYAYNADVEFFD